MRRSPSQARSVAGRWYPAVLAVAALCTQVPAIGLAADSPQAATAPALPSAASADVVPARALAIAHSTETLPNGLRVIYHQDASIPSVVVNVSYHVGSRFEAAGRTGFAHLFEHLMFMGTARAPTKMFDAWMEQAGGWNNAWTSADRTNYYDVGPKSALALLLWLEADRMRDVGALMTQEKLDAQRDIVRNERRQSYENRPYGLADLKLTELLFPLGHPYHHPVIGSHADLEAATVADVRAFFAKWYVPSNASLVVAGDFELQPTRALVNAYFAGIGAVPTPADPFVAETTPATPAAPATPARSMPDRAFAVLPSGQSPTVQVIDDVQLGRVTLAWRSADQYAPGDAELDLAATLLGDGETSRLHRQLVLQDRTAQAVSAHQASAAHGSSFQVEIMLRPGVAASVVVAKVAASLRALADAPPSAAELQRAQARFVTGFYTRLENLRERASLLSAYQDAVGTPDFVARDLARYRGATAACLQAAVRRLLEAPQITLEVVPRSLAKAAVAKGGAK